MKLWTSFTAALLVLCAPHFAFAQTAAAEALFQEGRALVEQGKFAEACPKLAESHRLDPATGTLLALAICHEGEGKLASAWAEFTDVEGRAAREGREDRVKLARERAEALRPRLSTLTIEVAPETASLAGLSLTLDGVKMGAGSFGVAVPVNGGEHAVEVSADGKLPWRSTVAVKAERDAARVAVPPLAVAPDAAPAAPAPAPAPVASASTDDGDSGSGMRTAALITGGAGVVALGIGSFLALDAKSAYDDAKAECQGTVCPEGPYQASEDARSQGTLATVVFALGGAAVATGAVLWFTAPSDDEASAPTGARVERWGIGPRGVVLKGSF